MMKYYLFLTLGALLTLAACTYTMKIQDGAMAYERKQYAVAVPMLKREYNKAKSRVEKGRLAYRLGQSYEALNKSEDALEWYRTAYDNGYGSDALRDYALALKKAERYEEAILAFRDLGLEIGSPYEFRREISGAEVAQGWLAENRPEFRVELLTFNTGNADYAPTLFRDNQLVFTSDRKGTTGDGTYNWTGNAFSDLFLVDLDANTVTGFDTGLNTEANEGTLTFNTDYTEVIFTRCSQPGKREDAYCKLMSSRINGDGSWSAATALDFIQEGINYMHPSLSADGQELYFSSEQTEGWGGYDIYVSQRTPDGVWGEPELLSRTINTEGDEQFPHIDADTLYFASTGHIGMGGLDIYTSYQRQGRWTPAYNLKPPINSGGDDFSLVFDPNAPAKPGVLRTGYFTSRRLDGAGGDDIYRFEKVVPPPAPPRDTQIVYRNLLDVYVLEKIYADPTDPNSRILGRRPLPGASVTINIGDRGRTVQVDEEGKLSLVLSEDTDYNFNAAMEGYLNNQARFSSRGLGEDPARPEQRYELEIELDKIFINREIVLENIYYDYDESFIRDDAKPTLDELANLLQLNPGIQIQLGSHTDCRGTDSYNEDLSQRRAQAAVDYLISKGIDAGRLRARGYGEGVPAADCACARCTEDEHQANRRTTFAIVE